MGDAISPPGSLGIGKIISLVDESCHSTGDDEYGRGEGAAPNAEGGRHVKRTDSLEKNELATRKVTKPGVASENAASDEECAFNHVDDSSI